MADKAGQKEESKRADDWMRIEKGLEFLPKVQKEPWSDVCDMAIFLGDCNMRLQNCSYPMVKKLSELRMYDVLLKNDEYRVNKVEEKIGCLPYTEPKVCFRPTYRLIKGTLNYDCKRMPSYTDRIFYKSQGDLLVNKGYNVIDCKISDHIPVYAIFDAKIRKEEKQHKAPKLGRSNQSAVCIIY